MEINIKFNRPAQVEIDTAALIHNVSVLRSLAPKSKIMAVVKSDAYGHGLDEVSSCLKGSVDGFAVACVGEALKLKQNSIDTHITILQGFTDAKELQICVQQGFVAVVHNHYQLELLSQFDTKAIVDVWLKADTGMGRLGFLPSEIKDVWQQLKNIKNTRLFGLFSHLSDADDQQSQKNQQQYQLFQQIKKDIGDEQIVSSLMNSGGTVLFEKNSMDWIRPGLMIYGASPQLNKTSDDFNLKPVMEFWSKVISIKIIPKGQSVGYGSSYTCNENTRVAVVAVGYGDGYPRHIKDGCVLIKKEKFSIIGRVSMDTLVVRIPQELDVQIGEKVVLWGNELLIEEIAQRSSTIAYDLMCSISHVKHIYN